MFLKGEAPDAPDCTEKPGYAARKRLRRRILRALGLWRREDYDIRFLRIDGEIRYKKVIFNTISDAVRTCDALESFGPSHHFPRLVGRDANELLVEFVDGNVPSTIDESVISGLTDFYAAVHRHSPRQVALAQTPLPAQFEENLSYLWQHGLIDTSTREALRDEHAARVPERVWIGFDYTDPIKNNLVVRSGSGVICAVDVKNLQSEMLIGRGIAKASRRWLTDTLTGPFFEQLRRKGAPDFQPYFSYVKIFDSMHRMRCKVAAENKLARGRKIRYMMRKKLQLHDFMT